MPLPAVAIALLGLGFLLAGRRSPSGSSAAGEPPPPPSPPPPVPPISPPLAVPPGALDAALTALRDRAGQALDSGRTALDTALRGLPGASPPAGGATPGTALDTALRSLPGASPPAGGATPGTALDTALRSGAQASEDLVRRMADALRAPAVQAPPPEQPLTAREAAIALRAYLAGGGLERLTVARYQRAMGLTADGVVGPRTRAALDRYDPRPAAPRPAAPRPAVPRGIATQEPGARIVPTPEPRGVVTLGRIVQGAPAQRTAASGLRAYLARGGRDRATVARYQRAMGLTADGVAGPRTLEAIRRYTT